MFVALVTKAGCSGFHSSRSTSPKPFSDLDKQMYSDVKSDELMEETVRSDRSSEKIFKKYLFIRISDYILSVRTPCSGKQSGTGKYNLTRKK